MAGNLEIINQIKFHLAQLSSNNEHHKFEDICRHLTRLRICSNILPATGPVASGGDQGRDFESFSTYIKETSLNDSSFFKLKSDKKIVGACTTQKSGILTKIKNDIKKIVGQGDNVEIVYFFTTEAIPISKIHELQKFIREDYSLQLEVLDINAISELLAQKDIFWIANEFLNIPSELYPKISEDDEYNNIFNKWKESDPFNYADFVEIKNTLRNSYSNEEYKQDLNFWMNKIKYFFENDFPQELKNQAIYEYIIANLRGKDTLIGLSSLINGYFNDLDNLKNYNEIEDRNIILYYCAEAEDRNIIEIDKSILNNWHKKLIHIVEKEIENNIVDPKKLSFLELRGYQHINPLLNNIEKTIEIVMASWVELIENVKNVPLFPIQTFSNRINFYAPIIENHSQYEYLIDQVDILLSERVGNFQVAQNNRNRAMSFYERGKIVKAINSLHNSKIQWFSDETIYGSLLSTTLISHCYGKLGLYHAAKYYAMITAFIAIHSNKDEVKKFIYNALLLTADHDYVIGSWCGFLDAFLLSLRYYNVFSDGEDCDDDLVYNIHYYISILIWFVRTWGNDELKKYIGEIEEKYPINEGTELFLPEIELNFSNKLDDIWPNFEDQILGMPFSDCGISRNVTFNTFGIKWNINWENDYNLNILSEQFISSLQVFLIDILKQDLCLIETDVEIKIKSNNQIDDITLNRIPSNEDSKWELSFPPHDKIKMPDFENKLQDFLLEILFDISLLNQKSLVDIIKNAFNNDLINKLIFGESYCKIYQDLFPVSEFNKDVRLSELSYSVREFNSTFETEELKWPDGIGPTYTKEISEEAIKNRYNRAKKGIEFTIKRLTQNPKFTRKVLGELRKMGWKDWHILLIINNIALNYRANELVKKDPTPLGTDPGFWYDLKLEIVRSENEKETSKQIPLSEFTLDKFIFHMNFVMIASLQVFDLECRQPTPNIESIDKFLKNRYNFWDDDIEHVPLF